MSDEEKIISLANAREKERPETDENESTGNEPVYCSFCGRPNHMVIKMIKGPNVNICSECVMVCIQYFMLDDKLASDEAQKVLDTFWRGAKK